MNLHTIDWCVIAAYALFAIGVGVYFSRRAGKNAEEFFLSGRTLPWWITGTSMVATTFAADTPLLITGWVRDKGIWMNWQWWCFAVGGMLTVFIFARYWRRGEVMTSAELSELRYGGREAGVLRGFLGVAHAGILNTIVLCWVLLAAGKIMGVVFDFDMRTALVIASVLSLSYSLLAGFWGVVITDIVQFAMAMTGAVCFAFIAWNAVGGLTEIETTVAALGESGRDILRLVPRAGEGGFTDASFWTVPIAAFAVFLGVSWWATYGIDGGPVVIQRISASRTPRDGLLGALWYNVANYALRPWPWIAVGLASLVVLPSVSIDAPVAGRVTAFTTSERIEFVRVHEEGQNEPTEISGPYIALPSEGNLAIPKPESPKLEYALRYSTFAKPDSTLSVLTKAVVRTDPIGTITITSADGTDHILPLAALANWELGAPDIPNDLLGRTVSVGDTFVKTDSERAYVVMMMKYLPVGLLGLVVASLLAAFMSTIDTHVNLAASFYVNDIHRRFFFPDASGAHLVLAGRLASVVVLTLGALLAAASDSIANLFTFFLSFLGGLGPVYLLRWLWWRVSALTEIAAMVASILTTIVVSWPWLQTTLFGSEIVWQLGPLSPGGVLSGEGRILVVIAISGTASLITLFAKRPDPAKLVPFYEKVRPIGAWGPVRALTDARSEPGEATSAIIGVVSGLALTYSMMFGIGFIMLGRTTGFMVCLVITLGSAVGVIHACRKLAAREPESPS